MNKIAMKFEEAFYNYNELKIKNIDPEYKQHFMYS